LAKSKAMEFRDFVWSPDSKWVAYTLPDEETLSKVCLRSVEKGGPTIEITDGFYTSYGPAFSGDRKYLFFVSDRDFNPTLGTTQRTHVDRALARIYFVPREKETESPFKPRSDESGAEAPKPAEPMNPSDPKKPAETIKVDPDGIQERVLDLPVAAGNYR